MKSALIYFSLLLSFNSLSQNFYDRSVVQNIELFFSFANWDAQLDAAAATESYIIADSVRINGVSFDSVGVKYKGNSTYNPTNNKNPFHIKLDYIKSNQDYQGFADLKLQNGYRDPSMIREVLSYAILEQYMDCPKANFANVYINGGLRGLYSNAEDISDDFNAAHFYSSEGSFFKCNPVGGAGPGTTIGPDLNYINSDTASYVQGYELKSIYGWTDLVDMINVLNNNFSQIETKLDIDRAIWMLAYNNVLVNLDSYNGAFRQNYYLYRDINDRFVTTVWDLNMSFGGFPGGTGSGATVATTLDPMSNSTSAIHPLIKKILGDPMYKRMYMAHLRTIAQEIFISGDYLTSANTLRTTINSSVQADPYKFYTFAQFTNSLTTSVASGGGGGGSIPGIQALMAARISYLTTNANYLLVAPVITSYASSVLSPTINTAFYITATCTNETAVYLGYRTSHPLKFNRVLMFDDGTHGDGIAGDHVYGYQVSADGPVFEYYIYADNNVAGLFSPQRAEHEFHSLTLSAPIPQVGNVLINEILASNSTVAFDNYGESDDWIELYNTTNTAFDLSGLYLSDDPLNYVKWTLPAGTVILPNDYLIIWTDDDATQVGLHTNFKLGSTGETIYFSNGVTMYDAVGFSFQTTDISYARCPDGGANFAQVIPTFDATNTCLVGLEEDALSVAVYPVPFQDYFMIESVDQGDFSIQLVDIQGRILLMDTIFSNTHRVDASNWKSGIYFLHVNQNGKEIVKTILKI
jgi:hypothetical protein